MFNFVKYIFFGTSDSRSWTWTGRGACPSKSSCPCQSYSRTLSSSKGQNPRKIPEPWRLFRGIVEKKLMFLAGLRSRSQSTFLSCRSRSQTSGSDLKGCIRKTLKNLTFDHGINCGIFSGRSQSREAARAGAACFWGSGAATVKMRRLRNPVFF